MGAQALAMRTELVKVSSVPGPVDSSLSSLSFLHDLLLKSDTSMSPFVQATTAKAALLLRSAKLVQGRVLRGNVLTPMLERAQLAAVGSAMVLGHV